jgi:hypothetical protein
VNQARDRNIKRRAGVENVEGHDPSYDNEYGRPERRIGETFPLVLLA